MGAALVHRTDDTAEVVKERLAAYHAQTQPLEAYYKGQGLVWRLMDVPRLMPFRAGEEGDCRPAGRGAVLEELHQTIGSAHAEEPRRRGNGCGSPAGGGPYPVRMREMARPGVTTAEMNAVAEDMIAEAGAQPLFRGVKTRQAKFRSGRLVAERERSGGSRIPSNRRLDEETSSALTAACGSTVLRRLAVTLADRQGRTRFSACFA